MGLFLLPIGAYLLKLVGKDMQDLSSAHYMSAFSSLAYFFISGYSSSIDNLLHVPSVRPLCKIIKDIL